MRLFRLFPTAEIASIVLLMLVGNRLPRLLFSLLLLSAPLLPAEEILRLTFLGDYIPHTGLHETTPEAFERLLPLFADDTLTFLNLETPLVENAPPAGFPAFNAHPPFLAAALASGVEVVSLANNHILDLGAAGVSATRGALVELTRRYPELRWSGVEGWRNREGGPAIPAPRELSVGGCRIGFLSVTQFLNRWPRGMAAEELVNLVDGRNRERFLAQLQSSAEGYDLFILGYHGDAYEEYRHSAESAKAALFARLLAAGVDILWGHHPHVPQEPLFSPPRDHRGGGIAISSAGNFLTGQGGSVPLEPSAAADPLAWTRDGFVYRIVLRCAPGEVEFLDFRLIPITTREAPTPGGVEVLPLTEAISEEPNTPRRGYFERRAELLEATAARAERRFRELFTDGSGGTSDPTHR